MRNITVSVDDRVYHRARVRAAEMHTSVSAFVRKSLQEIAMEETDFERAVRRECALVERIHSRKGRYSASSRLTRDKVHARHALC
jgi:plasmid stability protein